MSHVPSFLAGGRRARNQPSQPEIIETNPARRERPIVWRSRWLDGWMDMYGQADSKLAEGVGLSSRSPLESAVPDRVVGETSATDVELADMARTLVSRMECSNPASSLPPAKYDFVRNSCHTFPLRLLEDIVNFDIGIVNMRAFAGFDVETMGTLADMGKLGERHFGDMYLEYQLGAVGEERARRQALIAAV
ncbi:hypothetical protein BDV06DRAFT_209074 [Aspergillus oleicola]